jgi:hypothetical protein
VILGAHVHGRHHCREAGAMKRRRYRHRPTPADRKTELGDREHERIDRWTHG